MTFKLITLFIGMCLLQSYTSSAMPDAGNGEDIFWDAELFNSQAFITDTYCMVNRSVADDLNEEVYSVLYKILKPKSSTIVADPDTNSLIISSETSFVRAAIQFLSAFDKSEFKEKVAYVPVFFEVDHPAQTICDLLQSIGISTLVECIPVCKNNALDVYVWKEEGIVLLGKQEHIDIVKTFINNHFNEDFDHYLLRQEAESKFWKGFYPTFDQVNQKLKNLQYKK